METYIKIYDWMAYLPIEERVVYALILQMSENGLGYWAGYKAMADRLHMKKSECKRYIELLVRAGLVTVTTESINHKTRRVFRAKRPF